ncbi:cohesin domain-containing protein [Haloferula sp.]|uniref:cohesin domain-containing protein n=1 Tax=Haloferula sp. TaxID=2497595 RepID=UPI0032A06883
MKNLLLILLTSLLSLTSAHGARSFSIGEKSATPGSLVVFPIELDHAGGFASIALQLNYDPQILEFLGFSTGAGLGSQFESISFAADGVANLIWTRPSDLTSGTGCLGLVSFRVNDGAEVGSTTSLAISDVEAGDETGVIAFSLSETIAVEAGLLSIVAQPTDTDLDGMPDDWEMLHSLNHLVPSGNLDSDHDGRSDLLEYALGGNPRKADSGSDPFVAFVAVDDEDFLTLRFGRRRDGQLLYQVWESDSLGLWEEVDLVSRLMELPQDLGDGLESVTVRSRFKKSGDGSSPKGFMKLEVTQP